MRFLVLGSAAAVSVDDEVLALGARKPRSVVAALAMTPGRPVPADALADLVWAGEPRGPPTEPCTPTSRTCVGSSSPGAPPAASRP